MHPSPAFHASEDQARELIAAFPLATIAVNGPQGPVMAIAPLVWRAGERRLFGHVSRGNAFWKLAADAPVSAVAIFRGADAYVSPSAYPSKHEDGKAVPTWNYLAAQARGLLSLQTSPDAMAPFIEPLTDHMEAGRSAPWRVSDAPDTYVAALSAGIVGFELDVTELTCVRKLSQNKSHADRAGVIADLETRTAPNAAAIAQDMKQETG